MFSDALDPVIRRGLLARAVLLCLAALLALALSPAQPALAQAKDVASYQISVRLDPDQKTLQGTERITFLNDSSRPVQELYFHLYPNAFRGPSSTFMRENPGAAARAESANSWGGMDVTSLRLADGQDLLPGSTVDDTVMRVPLPSPLAPGRTLHLEAGFTVKMPRLIARMGYQGDQYTVAQWFPKLAALTERGWVAHQYHAESEFFADFGSYRVEITLPERFVVGATGVLTNERSNGDGTKTQLYEASSVHDFAWVANPAFREGRARAGNTEVLLLYPPEHEELRDRFLAAAVASLESFGAWYGPYPYPLLTVADVPESAGAGMEYPTLVTVSSALPLPGLLLEEQVTIHEIAHQWFYGVLASNEFEEAWLDEGFATYSTRKLAEGLYGKESSMGPLAGVGLGELGLSRGQYLAIAELDLMVKNSWEFHSPASYQGNVYAKGDLVLATLEGYLGEEMMGRVMREYFQRFAFKHPTSRDFVETVRQLSGRDFGRFFDQALYSTAVFDYSVEPLETQWRDGQYSSTVTARRMEEGVMPVEVVTTFQDGHQERETWDGEAGWRRFEYYHPSPAVKAEVDPEHKLLLDVRWANNSYLAQPDPAPLQQRAADLLWLFQSALKLLAQFL